MTDHRQILKRLASDWFKIYIIATQLLYINSLVETPKIRQPNRFCPNLFHEQIILTWNAKSAGMPFTAYRGCGQHIWLLCAGKFLNLVMCKSVFMQLAFSFWLCGGEAWELRQMSLGLKSYLEISILILNV